MSTAKKILGNTAVQVAGRAIMAVTSIVILKAISGFLSVSGYGMYTAVYEFLAFFGIAADLGLFTIAVREMGRGVRERDFIAGNIFGMRVALAVVMMSLAVTAAFLIPTYEGTPIPVGIAIASLSVFLSIMHGTVSSVLQVELKMQYSTIGLVVGKLISLGWMLAAIYWVFAGEPSDSAFYQLMVAGTVGNLFAFLYTYFYALKYVRMRPMFSREYWREILMTAAPYGAALVLNMIYFRIDSLMILFMKGPTELGYFGPPMRILEILSVIPVYFMNSVLPVLSRAVKEAGALRREAGALAQEGGASVREASFAGVAKVTRILQLSQNFLFMAGLPIVIGLYLLAYPIVFLITQPEFLSQLDKGIYGSDIALQILVLAMFFSYLNSLFNYSLVAAGKQNHLLWINGSAAVLNILVNFLVIPPYGFRGAAWTSVGTELFILLVSGVVASRYYRFKFDFLSLGKIAVAGGVMGVSVWLLKEPTYHLWGLQNLNVILLAVLGALIYGVVLLALGAVPEEFRRRVVSKEP